MNAFDLSNPEDSVNECREIAQKVLGKDWEGELEKAWRGVDDTGRLWALGHCHIDTACESDFGVDGTDGRVVALGCY